MVDHHTIQKLKFVVFFVPVCTPYNCRPPTGAAYQVILVDLLPVDLPRYSSSSSCQVGQADDLLLSWSSEPLQLSLVVEASARTFGSLT